VNQGRPLLLLPSAFRRGRPQGRRARQRAPSWTASAVPLSLRPRPRRSSPTTARSGACERSKDGVEDSRCWGTLGCDACLGEGRGASRYGGRKGCLKTYSVTSIVPVRCYGLLQNINESMVLL
jgi:hypothetical protein